MSTVKVSWTNNLRVVADVNLEKIKFDTSHQDRSSMNGSDPTDVFLSSIIACSTMTTISILNKMNVSFQKVEAYIETDSVSEIDHPSIFSRFRIKYLFEGVYEIDYEKLEKCVEMSHNKYCPMVYMASKIAPVQYELHCDGRFLKKSDNWEHYKTQQCESEICEPYYSYHK